MNIFTYLRLWLSKLKHKTKYKCPKLAVDIIVTIGSTILLINRKNEPFGLALPGGFVDYGESCEDAAVRELNEETGLVVKKEDLSLFCVRSDPKRDPRGHVVSVVYYATIVEGEPKAADDARSLEQVTWLSVEEKSFVFDHKEIITDFMAVDFTAV